MIAIGALIVLVGLLFLLFGAVIGGASSQFESQMPGFTSISGAVTGVVIVFAIIFLAIGILEVVPGVKVLGGRSWARMTGLVLAVLLGLIGLGSLGGVVTAWRSGSRGSSPTYSSSGRSRPPGAGSLPDQRPERTLQHRSAGLRAQQVAESTRPKGPRAPLSRWL
jgi:hypothetical protein